MDELDDLAAEWDLTLGTVSDASREVYLRAITRFGVVGASVHPAATLISPAPPAHLSAMLGPVNATVTQLEVPVMTVPEAARHRERFGMRYPLAHLKPFTDGRKLLLELQREAAISDRLRIVTGSTTGSWSSTIARGRGWSASIGVRTTTLRCACTPTGSDPRWCTTRGSPRVRQRCTGCAPRSSGSSTRWARTPATSPRPSDCRSPTSAPARTSRSPATTELGTSLVAATAVRRPGPQRTRRGLDPGRQRRRTGHHHP